MAQDFKQLPSDVAARPGRARRVTLHALETAPLNWGRAEAQVQRLIREEPSLRSTERRFVADATWAILRRYDSWRRLGQVVCEGEEVSALLLYYLYLVVERDLSPDVAAHHLREAGIAVEPAGWRQAWRELLDQSTAPEQQALAFGVPLWLVARLEASWGEQTPDLLAALNQRAPVDFRVNIAAVDRETIREQLSRQGITTVPTPYSPWGLRLEGHANVRGLPSLRTGALDLQDEGSQLIVRLAAVEPGQDVADVCAGGGGKSVALAPLLGKKGRLVGMDADPQRLRAARERMAKLTFHYHEELILSKNPAEARQQLEPWATGFDRVLVDAPCSGTGAWRRHPAARWLLTEEFLAELVDTQAALLDLAATLVRPGRRLVYATCSVLAEENEQQVEAFLRRQSGFQLVPAAAVLGEGGAALTDVGGRYLSLAPHRQGTDGFFGAVLERMD